MRDDETRGDDGFDLLSWPLLIFLLPGLAGFGAFSWVRVQRQQALVAAQRAMAAEARARAEAERARAEAANESLGRDLLAEAGPARGGPTAVEALDRAADRLGGAFAGDPETEATVREALARSYENLGESAKADVQRRAAADLRRAAEGPGSTGPRGKDAGPA